MACLSQNSEVVKKFLEAKAECDCGSLVQPWSLKAHRGTKKHARLMEERAERERARES